jgi:hypothetical protein
LTQYVGKVAFVNDSASFRMMNKPEATKLGGNSANKVRPPILRLQHAHGPQEYATCPFDDRGEIPRVDSTIALLGGIEC